MNLDEIDSRYTAVILNGTSELETAKLYIAATENLVNDLRLILQVPEGESLIDKAKKVMKFYNQKESR